MTKTEPVLSAPPLPPYSETVRPEWVDYNGHMNVAYYVLVFDHATDALLDAVGLGEAYRLGQQGSLFIVEAHVAYARELHVGDPVRIETQILGHDDKRLHAFLSMVQADSGELAATYEILGLHVDMESRWAAPFPAFARARIRALAALHASRPRPPGAGRGISLRARR
ncbi:MAG: thioesterase-like protein [Rhodospirillales bacterium]|nr:thioesterase-like protein [Rhodospirillales bacterium]MSP80384.1 thioesterase-like protein [Rhodospirillales bacterium]